MKPPGRAPLETLHKEQLGIAFVEVLNDAARLEAELHAESLHSGVRLIGRCEELRGSGPRFDGGDEGGGHPRPSINGSDDEQREEVVLEEPAVGRIADDLSVAFGHEKPALDLGGSQIRGAVVTTRRLPVESGNRSDLRGARGTDYDGSRDHDLASVQALRTGHSGEQGQLAVYAVLLFPVLMLVLALVLAVGTIEGLRTRIRAQLDMAALTATQALDPAALAAGEPPSIQVAEAERLAREYLARNLAATDDSLVASPSELASAAEVVISNEPGTDPITGAQNTAPTVSIRVAAPARIPLLGLVGIGPVVTLTIDGSASARS
jgi:hypothetical protein